MNEFNYKELAAMAEDMIERVGGEDQSRLMTIHNAFLDIDSIMNGVPDITPAPGFLAKTRFAIAKKMGFAQQAA